MKQLFILFLLAFTFLLFTNSSCKKNKDKNITACACNATDIKYQLQNIDGTLSFYQYNSKWVFSYHPATGNISNYFPCNTDQDSLKAILQGANQNQVFQVKLSGKVKEPCPGENFGIVSGVSTFDYIIIDSLKRN